MPATHAPVVVCPVSRVTLATPLGPMVAVASGAGLRLLEFADGREVERAVARALRGDRVGKATNDVIETLRDELRRYFAGARPDFTTPLDAAGTPFQERVWEALRAIPYGTTTSYHQLAVTIGQPTATRAVAQANARNPVSILSPCHRVIGKDGTLTGYGGGVERKRWLLELEGGATSTTPLPLQGEGLGEGAEPG